MRVWGRVNGNWVQVNTASDGTNSALALTWLIQVLKLNQGESPFYATWGIPAQSSVMTQIQPDMAVSIIQQQFAPYFASLVITKVAQTANNPNPTYNITAVALSGTVLSGPIPT